MIENLIFLTEEDLDKSVYRIFSFERLKQMFDEQKFTLVKPSLWDDPFENFILNSTGILPDGREFEIGFRNTFYGQCWSLTRESDAMWRIYSPDKDGVKVKTTIRKLFSSFFNIVETHRKFNGNKYKLSTFIGKVKYSSTKDLTAMLKDKERMSSKIFDQSGWGQASSFYFKRWAFRHEKEVRLMYNSHQSNTDKIFKFDFNPSNVIDEIVFDPRMKNDIYMSNKTELIQLGFNKKIIQSGLYKLKKFTIELNSK